MTQLAARIRRGLLAAIALAPIGAIHSVHAADMSKVLRVAFPVDVTGFDPQAFDDSYSVYINSVVFEPLFRYDYLARPYKLIPNTAEALPEIREEGKLYVIKVRKGIYFTPDPAFNGRRRELTAADYIYSWKRLLDPRVRSPNVGTFENKLVGADAITEAAKASGRFDYDAPMAGLSATDRYTIQIRLKEPSYTLSDRLVRVATGAVAREVIEKHADASNWAADNPVGTGPYVLKEWRRGSKVVLEANPDYRDRRFPENNDPADKTVAAQMKGKKLPAIGRIEISIIEESNPRLLTFQAKQFDLLYVPTGFVDRVIENGALKPEFAQQGISWTRSIETGWTYTIFNMDDPAVGGYSKEKIALRRAVGLGYDVSDEIAVIRQGQAIPATQPIPPNLPGHDPTFKRPNPYDPVAARALLDRFGYKDCNGDGYRELPDCAPLVLKYHVDPSELGRRRSELWKKSMDAIGIRIEFNVEKWPETLKAAKAGKVMMWGLGYSTEIRDGQPFLAQLYSKYIDYANYSRFRMDSYDRLFELAQAQPDGPERNRIYRALSDHFVTYAPVLFSTYRINNALVHPWVLGWKMHSFDEYPFLYLDIDTTKQRLAQR